MTYLSRIRIPALATQPSDGVDDRRDRQGDRLGHPEHGHGHEDAFARYLRGTAVPWMAAQAALAVRVGD